MCRVIGTKKLQLRRINSIHSNYAMAYTTPHMLLHVRMCKPQDPSNDVILNKIKFADERNFMF